MGSHRVIMNRLSWYLDRKPTGQAKPKSFRLFSYGKNTFLFVFIRILPHILGDSPASQTKIIQQGTGQWLSVLWLHIFFFIWRCTALCNKWKSTDGGFVDLSVFCKNKGVYGLRLPPQITCGCQCSTQHWVKSICWKPCVENKNFKSCH